MSNDAAEGPATNGYQATGSTQRRQPAQSVQAAPTPIKVEPKVWFANERTWISYLNTGILLGTMALVLFNAAHDNITRYFAYAYAVISVLVMVYGYVVYQHRITLIRRRDPGHFDQIVGPLVICALLFVAVLTNFLVRWREAKRA